MYTSCTEYINNFNIYVCKLPNLVDTWTYDKFVREFKQGVYNMEHNMEFINQKGTFTDLVSTVRKRGEYLDHPVDNKIQNNKPNHHLNRQI